MSPSDPHARRPAPNTPRAASRPPGGRATGARLKAQRTALGLSLAQAADASGVRAPFITAIERGDADALPASGYALGYVRAYARALGLDADAAVAEFKRELAGAPVPRPKGVPHFVPTRSLRLPRGSVPALGIVAAVMMLGMWYGVQLDTQSAPAPLGTDAAAAGEAQADTRLPDNVVSLRATAPSWVSIRNARGELVANRVLVPGERWQAPRGEAFSVTVRDGGAVELHVGERSLGPLGRTGERVVDFQLGAVTG